MPKLGTLEREDVKEFAITVSLKFYWSDRSGARFSQVHKVIGSIYKLYATVRCIKLSMRTLRINTSIKTNRLFNELYT